MVSRLAGILEKITELESAHLVNWRKAVQLEKGILYFPMTKASLKGAKITRSSDLRADSKRACFRTQEVIPSFSGRRRMLLQHAFSQCA